jgi:transcriptional regulator with XRE-family HTH domain
MPSTADVEAVGRIVREARERRGWLQADLRQHTGIRQQQISKLECGQIANPDLGEVIRICDALDIDLDDIAKVFRRPSGRRRPQLERLAS